MTVTIFLLNLALSLGVGVYLWGAWLGNPLLGAADGVIVAGTALWWVRLHRVAEWRQLYQSAFWWLNIALCSGIGAYVGGWFGYQTIGGLAGAALMLVWAFGQEDAGPLQDAYDFFNAELFGGVLPAVLITLRREPDAHGYFLPNPAGSWELALNPDGFSGRSDREILSTLVHEMVHVWQEACGNPSRGDYHNQQWAAKMCAIGLQPTATGQPGGQQTGVGMTHLIIPDGAYAHAYAALQTRGFRLQQLQLNEAL
jgi:hypothetical protein